MWPFRDHFKASPKVIVSITFVLLMALFLYALLRDNVKIITRGDAIALLMEHKVKAAVIKQGWLYLQTDSDNVKISKSLIENHYLQDYTVKQQQSYVWFFTLLACLLSLYAIWKTVRLNKNRNIESTPSLQNSSASALEPLAAIKPMQTSVRFSDIGGISDVKIELEEIIDFLKNPAKYRAFGAYMPRGVLLVGPPGVGKTMIAKAVANEADAPFYYQSGASFVQIYVGMGAKRVEQLFQVAKKSAPAIIFIDEIDAVGKRRDGKNSEERDATLNQLLTEMDGFAASEAIVVIAATNKIDLLDEALLRPGRFDRRLFVELPSPAERQSILKHYLNNIHYRANIDSLVKSSAGFNGAALKALVNEAALLALRHNALLVDETHFEEARQKVLLGKRRLPMLNAQQREYLVYYQSAKAMMACLYQVAFEKVQLLDASIKPEPTTFMLKHQIEARIKVLLSGMVAVDERFAEHASNVDADVKEAKGYMKQMIEQYAMYDALSSEQLFKRFILSLQTEMKQYHQALEQIVTVMQHNEVLYKEDVQKVLNVL